MAATACGITEEDLDDISTHTNRLEIPVGGGTAAAAAPANAGGCDCGSGSGTGSSGGHKSDCKSCGTGNCGDAKSTNTATGAAGAAAAATAAAAAAAANRMCGRCKLRRTACTFMDQKVCAVCYRDVMIAKFKIALRRVGVVIGLPNTHTRNERSRAGIEPFATPKVIVAYSGGTSSAALAYLVSLCSLQEGTNKPLFEYAILHIDESAIWNHKPAAAAAAASTDNKSTAAAAPASAGPLTAADVRIDSASILAAARRYGVTVYTRSITDVFDLPYIELLPPPPPPESPRPDSAAFTPRGSGSAKSGGSGSEPASPTSTNSNRSAGAAAGAASVLSTGFKNSDAKRNQSKPPGAVAAGAATNKPPPRTKPTPAADTAPANTATATTTTASSAAAAATPASKPAGMSVASLVSSRSSQKMTKKEKRHHLNQAKIEQQSKNAAVEGALIRVPRLTTAASATAAATPIASAIAIATATATAADAKDSAAAATAAPPADEQSRIARLHALFTPLLHHTTGAGSSAHAGAAIHDASDAQDMLDYFRSRLLADTASRYGFSHVLTGDSASRAAITIITSTAKGRGDAIPAQLSEVHEMRFNVKFVQPLRDVLTKNLSILNRYNHIESSFHPSFSTALPTKRAGLFALSEQFVLNLQDKFSGTIFNILRTCEKLRPSPHVDRRTSCGLCGRGIVSDVYDVRYAYDALATKSAPASTATTSTTATATDGKSAAAATTRVALCYACDLLLTTKPQSAAAASAVAAPELPAFLIAPPPKPAASGGIVVASRPTAPLSLSNSTMATRRAAMAAAIADTALPDD